MIEVAAHVIWYTFLVISLALTAIILPGLTIAMIRERRDLHTMKARRRANEAMKKNNI